MARINVEAVGKLLGTLNRRPTQRQGYIYAMPTFTLAGVAYDYLVPELEGDPEGVRSWECGHWPKVEAAVPLTAGGTIQVYGEASRWGHRHAIVSWLDDAWQPHWTWVPAAKVRRLTDSEWDISEYHRCPEHLRGIQWGSRLPGVLPA